MISAYISATENIRNWCQNTNIINIRNLGKLQIAIWSAKYIKINYKLPTEIIPI